MTKLCHKHIQLIIYNNHQSKNENVLIILNIGMDSTAFLKSIKSNSKRKKNVTFFPFNCMIVSTDWEWNQYTDSVFATYKSSTLPN